MKHCNMVQLNEAIAQENHLNIKTFGHCENKSHINILSLAPIHLLFHITNQNQQTLNIMLLFPAIQTLSSNLLHL